MPKKSLPLLFLFLFFFVLVALLVFRYAPRLAPPSSPPPATSDDPVSHVIIGFLPYWNLSRFDNSSLSSLTALYYFSLPVSKTGRFDQTSPGWRQLSSPKMSEIKSSLRSENLRYGLSVSILDADTISAILSSPEAQTALIADTIAVLESENADDLNIDIEYNRLADPSLRSPLSTFVANLSAAVKKSRPQTTISLDLYADTVVRPRIYDLKTLAPSVDYIFIMAYDFYKTNSLRAGPVAPLTGRQDYGYDVSSSVSDYLAIIPASKLILGIPLYGYEWPVDSPTKHARVVPSSRSPEVSSYRRSLETLAAKNASLNFDDSSKSPWFAYFDSDTATYRQVWFENETSLSHKLDLVNAKSLAGIAFFALGYEGPNASPLWEAVSKKLSPLP